MLVDSVGSTLFDVRLLCRVELHSGSVWISDLDEITSRTTGHFAMDGPETLQLIDPSWQIVGGQSQDVESLQGCHHSSFRLVQTQDHPTRVMKNGTYRPILLFLVEEDLESEDRPVPIRTGLYVRDR